METRSFNSNYIDNISVNLGTMFEYAASLGYDEQTYWNYFALSEVAKEIEKGNPKFCAGYSAIDLLEFVLKQNEGEVELINPKPFFDRTKHYWAGWAIAQYQNYKSTPFNRLKELVPINKVLSLYDTLHEADISKFYEVIDEYISSTKHETNLKRMRIARGLSQSQLAKKANVSIRNIQMYEQRQNNINKAQGDILFKLSKVIGCNIEDLLEF